jgi:hypothetical protein
MLWARTYQQIGGGHAECHQASMNNRSHDQMRSGASQVPYTENGSEIAAQKPA